MEFQFPEFMIQELFSLININNLLNSTKKLNEYNKRFFYWRLGQTHSFKYYNDTEFYNYINSKMMNPNKQLCISIIQKSITSVKHLGNVHTLDLHFCCSNIIDVNCLGNVKFLNLSGCSKIIDENIVNLGNVYDLNLSGCNYITDEGIRHLGNVYKLDLSWCSNIKNISFLGNVHTLNLSVCNSITDDGLDIQLAAGEQRDHPFPDRPMVAEAALEGYVFLYELVQVES